MTAMYMDIPEEVVLQGVQRACSMTTEWEIRWGELTQRGANNERINQQISYELNIWGGCTMEWGWQEHKGGSNPLVKIRYDGDGGYNSGSPVTIKGELLTKLVRRIFDIPSEAGQLTLF